MDLQSPTPLLLQTNSLPTAAERIVILDAIHRAEKELSRTYDKEGARSLLHQVIDIEKKHAALVTCYDSDKVALDMEEIFVELDVIRFYSSRVARGAALRQFIGEHRGIISPLRRFPPELLVEIFLLSVPHRPFHTELTHVLPYEYPLYYHRQYALSQVCRYWREIALNTPHLWTDIPTIERLAKPSRSGSSGYALLVSKFLERSGELPLYVTVSLPWLVMEPRPESEDGEPRKPAKNFPRDIMRLLYHSSHRWKSAVLHMHCSLFGHLPPFKLPMLEQLNVRSYGFGRDRITATDILLPMKAIGSTPTLKYLIVDAQQSHIHSDRLYAQVETFVGLPEYLADLKVAQAHLTDCQFRGPVARMRFPDRNARLAFPKLRRLQISNTNYIDPMEFGRGTETAFAYIIAPALEDLVVEAHPKINEASKIVNDIVVYTLGQPSGLQHLTLHIFGIDVTEFTRILTATPLLASLDIWNAPSPCWQLLVFRTKDTPDGSENPLIPKLRSLTIRNYGIEDFSVFTSIHNSRCDPAALLNGIEGGLIIKLVYSRVRICRQAQDRVEGWHELEATPGSECNRLLGWSSVLAKHFVARNYDDITKYGLSGRQSRRKGIPRYDFHQLGAFFRVVEAYEVQDPRLLEATRIRPIMTVIATAKNGFLMMDDIFRFRLRAAQISGRWTELIVNGGVQRSRWILSDDGRTLTLPAYVSPHGVY